MYLDSTLYLPIVLGHRPFILNLSTYNQQVNIKKLESNNVYKSVYKLRHIGNELSYFIY